MKSETEEVTKKIYFKAIDLLHHLIAKKGDTDPYHKTFSQFVTLGKEASEPAVLEIGSRNVTGITRRKLFPQAAEYIGLDILEGEGVDIVGDVHKLSEIVPTEHFDLVYSISVFEHLMFPWKAVLEINRVMKQGAYVFVSTHPAWPAHELPWDFWRFQRNSFLALFNKYTGFEVITLTEGLPGKLYSLVDDPPTRGNCQGSINQGVALIAKKVGDYRRDLLRWDIDIEDVTDSMYPK